MAPQRARELEDTPSTTAASPTGGGGVRAEGRLAFERVYGRTTPTQLLASYPLRFLVPSRAVDSRVDCCWLYTMNYGGGLVAGDHVAIECDVGPGCTVAMTTQGSTKIYKAPPPGLDRRQPDGQEQQPQAHRRTLQSFTATVAAGATLALLPDPYTCFRDADYQQLQAVDVQVGGTLVLVDWFTSGRMGRGESWAFARLDAETRISLGGRPLLWEPLLLDNTEKGGQDGDTSVRQRMAGYECFCLLVLLGPRAEATIQAVSRTQGRPTFQQRVATGMGSIGGSSSSTRRGNAPTENSQRCITSLCRLWDGDGGGKVDGQAAAAVSAGNALALKVAGKATEDVYALLASLLAPLEPFVGCRPYSRRG